MRRTPGVLCLLGLCAALSSARATPIDGRTAARWSACPSWVTNPSLERAAAADGQRLVFTARGAGTEMPWTLGLRDGEMSGDDRYLLVRYRLEGASTQPGNYFLHGWEGTPGGRPLIVSDGVVADGRWHVAAVDLERLDAGEPIRQIALKLAVGEGGGARLSVERIWFAGALPSGASVAATPAPAETSVALDWGRIGVPLAAPGWITNPAPRHQAVVRRGVATFTVRGAGRAMRWPIALPEPIDLAAMPCLSVRYRLRGQPGRTAYAVWLGTDPSGKGARAWAPVLASNLRADGRWHTVDVRLGEPFRATNMAIGLDCDGEAAELALGPIRFAARPGRWPLRQALEHTVRQTAWPEGRGGFRALPPAARGGRRPGLLAHRLRLTDWFAGPHVIVDGVPFEVAADPTAAPQTGTVELGSVAVALPAGAREVYLLTAAAAPPLEPFGLDPKHPRAQEVLDQPEKVVLRIEYATGPSDDVLPVQAATGEWGMRRGLGVHVVHPDARRRAVRLTLREGMQTASFAILGVTVRAGAPRVREPAPFVIASAAAPGRLRPAHARPPAVAAGPLLVELGGPRGLRWRALEAPSLPGALACDPGPVFEVEIGGKSLPTDAWELLGTEPRGAGRRWRLRNRTAGLSAEVELVPGARGELLMRMSLRNEGARPVAATVRFPVLRGLRLGSAAGTWYVSGRRGGIVSAEAVRFRDPLGEPHPLQMDGFHSPRLGVALACLTHDTAARHHFVRLAKDARGGAWSPEYVEHDIAPGASFHATEAALALRPGGWRAVFDAYREWLATWYRAPRPKPWWERTFAFITRGAGPESWSDPRARGAVQPALDSARRYLGLCDYVHLFGWSGSTTYGMWGDYDHYDETVGGLDYFRGNIARAQAAGVGVGLYQDGYLSSPKGVQVGRHAAEWALEAADGIPSYVPEYDAYNECPYMPGWRAHLADVYGRVARETGARGLYIDEYGATDGRWLCRARGHGHNGYEIPYAGEVATLAAIRRAVGPKVALYTEYPPAEVTRTITDGSFTYQALWSADAAALAPHFIDLPRFAFPAFKQFHIIHYVPTRAGNAWILRFPFFNGESYNLGEPNLPDFDGPSLAFQRRALQVLCAHREAFTSPRPEPLVPTEIAGVFANRFPASKETVWTVYNAGGRTVRGVVLRVPHRPGARYVNAWEGTPLRPTIRSRMAEIALALGPRAVGCVAQVAPRATR
ncbi:MAG: hypothetical protein IT208_12960 [Chthonomonadales bacterium]|nr:hypothetical protein [Chthonomonadales bacterium]